MGIGKFFLKHGVGAPGSIAKAMAVGYGTIKSQNPLLSHHELTAMALGQRYTVIRSVSPAEQTSMLAKSGDNFANLIVEIVAKENPDGYLSAVRDHDVFKTMLTVVAEVLEKHMPSDVPRSVLRYDLSVKEKSLRA